MKSHITCCITMYCVCSVEVVELFLKSYIYFVSYEEIVETVLQKNF